MKKELKKYDNFQLIEYKATEDTVKELALWLVELGADRVRVASFINGRFGKA